MKKVFTSIIFLAFLINNTAFSQASAWKAFISDFSTGTNVTLPDAPICSYINNGTLRLPYNSNDYFANFGFNSPICVPNNFTFEYRLRNAPQYGGVTAYDVGFGMTLPQGEISASMMSNDIRGLPWTFISVNGLRQSNLPFLVRNFNEYSIVKVKCSPRISLLIIEALISPCGNVMPKPTS